MRNCGPPFPSDWNVRSSELVRIHRHVNRSSRENGIIPCAFSADLSGSLWKCCQWLEELTSLRELGHRYMSVRNTSCPSLSVLLCRLPSFRTFITIWRVFIYSLVTCVCSLPLPSQVKALGVGGLGLWVLSTSVELRGTQLTLMMSTFSVLFYIFCCFTFIASFDAHKSLRLVWFYRWHPSFMHMLTF